MTYTFLKTQGRDVGNSRLEDGPGRVGASGPTDRGCCDRRAGPVTAHGPDGCALLLLRLLGRQLHVLGRDTYRCAVLRDVQVRRPQDAIHDGLPESADAEVVVEVAADEAEGPPALRVGPLVDPADRAGLALDDRVHDRPRPG